MKEWKGGRWKEESSGADEVDEWEEVDEMDALLALLCAGEDCADEGCCSLERGRGNAVDMDDHSIGKTTSSGPCHRCRVTAAAFSSLRLTNDGGSKVSLCYARGLRGCVCEYYVKLWGKGVGYDSSCDQLAEL